MPVDDYWGTESTELVVEETVEVDLDGNPVVSGINRDIPKSIIDAPGDLIVGTDADSVGRLPIGSPGQALLVAPDGISLEYSVPVGEDHVHTESDITDFAHTHLEADITDFAHAHVLGDLPGDIATDGDVSAAVASHAGAGDPHPTYETSAEAAAKITAHEGAANPHPSYATDADLTTHAATPHGGGGVSIPQQDDEPASPVEDDLWIDTNEGAGVGLSSILAYAEATSNQTLIGTTITDRTGLSVTVAVPAGRRLRISGHTMIGSPSAALFGNGWVRDGTNTTLGRYGNAYFASTSQEYMWDGSIIISPAAGTHTFKLSVSTTTGTVTSFASSTNPAWIMVEDITGTLWPAGQSVDTGMLPMVPACRVYNGSAQSIPNGTETMLTFPAEHFDTDNLHSTSVNPTRITISRAGVYQVAGSLEFVANVTGGRYAFFKINGGTVIGYDSRANVTGTGWAHFMLSTIWNFSAGDYIEFGCYQSSGGALNTVASAGGLQHSPQFGVAYLGRVV